MRDPTKPWVPEEDETIKRLAGNGLSAAQIAEGLPGRSRNAVIGRLNRLGLVLSALQGRQGPRAKLYKPKSRPPKPVHHPRVVFPKPTVVEGEAIPASEDFIFDDSGPTTRVTLMELTDDTCRWPVGDLYCGGMTLNGKPYCAKHSATAHVPNNPRPPRRNWKTW